MDLDRWIGIIQNHLHSQYLMQYGYILKDNLSPTGRIGWNGRPLNGYTTLMRIRRK